MTTTSPVKRSAAMIASIADPGVPTTPAPFGHALAQLAAADERVVGLTADLSKYTDMHIFAAAHPDRYFEMGMAEQLMVGAAAGMAAVGLVPFATTYSVFATRRAYDFLCLDAAEPDLNVNIVAALPGLTTGYGPSHQATEDVAILRGMPDLTIFDRGRRRCRGHRPRRRSPARADVHAAPARPGPADPGPLRLHLRGGQGQVVRPGDDVVIVSSGLMTMRALLAAEQLSDEHGVEVSVVHCATLKPFDEDTVVTQLDTDRVAFTAENHTVVGGLFEAVAGALVRRGIGRRVTPIGLPDQFLDAGALPRCTRSTDCPRTPSWRESSTPCTEQSAPPPPTYSKDPLMSFNTGIGTRTAVVTGAGSLTGIGFHTAQRFAEEGWAVAMIDVNAAGLEQAAAAVRHHVEGTQVTTFVLDVTDPEAVGRSPPRSPRPIFLRSGRCATLRESPAPHPSSTSPFRSGNESSQST